ncbi:MAG: nodulation protein NfeD [Dehalococcoidia bacterium]
MSLLLLTPLVSSPATADNHHVSVVNIDGTIDPVMARYLTRSIEGAEKDQAELLIIILDTPGGFLGATRDMVESILSAEIPVATYVAPPGARAGSAGTFITAAANFAVMAPGSNIGAASPIASDGQDIPETLAKKINEDTRAFIRSIAVTRERNSQALEETVTRARSYSATEAVELNVVDFIAPDLSDLLEQLDGQTARTATGVVELQTQNLEIREAKTTLLENFLSVIVNPNLAFVLLIVGGVGILAEMMTPGLLGPGIVGVISLGLAFVAMGQLPVNWVGVGLILFAMVLFFLEFEESGVGVLGLGGVICLLLGSFLLFGGYFSSPDIPEAGSKVSLWIIGTVTGFLAVILALFIYLARPTGSATGFDARSGGSLNGQLGTVITVLNPTGRVRVRNQEWRATAGPSDLIEEGEEVVVEGVFGRLLKVSRSLPEDEPQRSWLSKALTVGKLIGGGKR